VSDPTERSQVNPHPVSGHRTPDEIAEDEAGPIGQPNGHHVAKKGSEKDLPSTVPAKRPRTSPTPRRRPKRG
jgi:hypothetical protein